MKYGFIFVMLPMMTIREVYLVFLNNSGVSVFSVCIINSLYMAYLILLSYIRIERGKKNMLFLYMVVLTTLNLVSYIVTNFRRSINVIFYCIEITISAQTVAKITIVLAYFFAVSGFLLHLVSFDKDWFDF